ncbi:PRTRC system protein A [Roseateles aquatilis]|jgi:PRTRC genetic system protein A|uniref:PRTRC system protein A n=1 Tax=Roseateles aquatilis TaxID=431061 RepID=A0A246J8N1_9BURK|nr:PRTRC system protein A [Roseateles aquatilis]MBY0365340.1 PRTRC system protein A [Burkholderiaceae bacterium]OWQ88892.1 PRTRC system protein A [Roseateles aquatilis]
MTPDPRDLALQATCPCVPVPRFGALPDLDLGQRVLVARNGLFLDVRRSWLRCVTRLADLPPTPPLPYGVLRERIEFAFGVIPVALLEAFVDQGRAGLPNEVAGALIYDASTQRLRLQVHEAVEAGPGGVRYRMPELAADESLAVDLHTHGRLPAFWSSTDNADDQGVKVCGVFGSLHRPRPSAAFRLAINGAFRPLAHPWQDEAPEEEADALELATRCPTLASIGFEEIERPWNT